MSTIPQARPSRTATRPQPGLWDAVKTVLKPVASLRLTVVLLVLSIVLVFLGTVAQVDDSIHTVLNKYFYTWIAKIPFQVIVRFGQKFLGVSKGTRIDGWFPFPGGWLLGGLLMINLLSAHTVRFKITWKRIGIWTIHLGLMTLLVGEFLSSQLKVEGRMRIEEGRSSNVVEHDRLVELAIVDRSQPDRDRVAVIPEHVLRKGGKVSHPDLPMDVEIVRYMQVSELTEDPPADNPATAGLGLELGAVPRKEVSGVNPSQKIDIPAVYVRFLDKEDGSDLGTYLLTRWLVRAQQVEAGDKQFDVSMRGENRTLPFALHLTDFRFDRFVGTGTAKNYSSDVQLLDPRRDEKRDLRISMNVPLLHDGETFYQADFDHNTERATVLQVVRNPGWQLPYLSCVLVAFGLMLHFGYNLLTFLVRRAAR